MLSSCENIRRTVNGLEIVNEFIKPNLNFKLSKNATKKHEKGKK